MGRRISPWYYVVNLDSEHGREDLFGTIYDGKAMLTYGPEMAERFTTRKQAEKFMRERLYMFPNAKRVREMYDHFL